MSKKAKLITIITSAVVAVALIVLAICLVVANNNREKTQTSIMTCSTNPSIQFVLNGNDKVMRVVALNNDGKALELNASFVGLKAEDAAELFVKLSTESGKIQVNTTGTTVTISFSGLKEDYSKLKDKAVSKVNSYFDEKGIIAGAIGNVESLKESLLKLKSTASDVETKTEQELMKQYQKVADAVSKIVPNEMENFYKKYDEFYAQYLKAKKDYEDGLTYWQELMKSLPEGYTEEKCKSAIGSLAKSWTSAQELFKKNVAGLAPTVESLQQAFNTLRNDFAKLITNYKAELEKHQTEFANNKAEIKQKIADFRASLNK
ncbi:MAG: hypothetical protein MR412_01735 [Firmicutes bacterium]|nr:hypothetical protein [Bacillota bacterium]